MALTLEEAVTEHARLHMAWLLAKQGDKGAVQAALAKVREERGPIDARKGVAPKAA